MIHVVLTIDAASTGFSLTVTRSRTSPRTFSVTLGCATLWNWQLVSFTSVMGASGNPRRYSAYLLFRLDTRSTLMSRATGVNAARASIPSPPAMRVSPAYRPLLHPCDAGTRGVTTRCYASTPPSLYPSSPRKRGSLSGLNSAIWIPAFAEMTNLLVGASFLACHSGKSLPAGVTNSSKSPVWNSN
jgi:hypothetical protein